MDSSSVIHFKFKSAKKSEDLIFEGVSLPIAQLKQAIIVKKGEHPSCGLVGERCRQLPASFHSA